jgi:hypothetical protein
VPAAAASPVPGATAAPAQPVLRPVPAAAASPVPGATAAPAQPAPRPVPAASGLAAPGLAAEAQREASLRAEFDEERARLCAEHAEATALLVAANVLKTTLMREEINGKLKATEDKHAAQVKEIYSGAAAKELELHRQLVDHASRLACQQAQLTSANKEKAAAVAAAVAAAAKKLGVAHEAEAVKDAGKLALVECAVNVKDDEIAALKEAIKKALAPMDALSALSDVVETRASSRDLLEVLGASTAAVAALEAEVKEGTAKTMALEAEVKVALQAGKEMGAWMAVGVGFFAAVFCAISMWGGRQ